MENVEDVRVKPLSHSLFIQPYSFFFKHNGKARRWDCLRQHNSIAVVIYNKTRDAFIVVKQFRPPVYMTANMAALESAGVFSNGLRMHSSDSQLAEKSEAAPQSQPQFGPASEGITYELCAGIIDKHTSLVQIAKEEVLEETGYDVPLEHFQVVNSYLASIGTAGTSQVLYYCEVTDNMQVSQGGGDPKEGELIDLLYIPVDKSMDFVYDMSIKKSSGLCFGFMWFDKFKHSKTTPT